MMTAAERTEAIEAALTEGANIARVIELRTVELPNEGLLVCAKVDLPADRTMREVSAILLQAERRVRAAVPDVAHVFLEPDVWVDPNTSAPTTSAVVMLGLD